MRLSTVVVAGMGAIALVVTSGLVTAATTTAAAASSAPAAARRERKPPTVVPNPASAESVAELLAAIQSLSTQVEEQTRQIGQLKRRLDEHSRETNGRLMAICLGTMTAVPSPGWGFPIGKADKAGILAACTQSERWNAGFFGGDGAPDVFVPFR